CGAKIGNANKKHGGTPLLHWAVGNAEFVRYLLDRGADADGKDYKGMTPLFTALLRGSPEALGLLLDNDADINQVIVTESDTLCWVGWRDETKHEFVRLHNVTPLLLAVCGWRKNMVELLLAYGADVNLRTAEGYTALAVAEKLRKKDIADLLRRNGGVE
ncbi:MAG: ankyrin repeat domain-containing protein, partial [Lentisphaerae bacterium]|nr:ankyrin repeat domain-containing protein [Lentisphaerota bacterium]